MAALHGFASELKLTDAADFAAFIRIGHMPNLQSLVQSSAELYFKPGTLELAELESLSLGGRRPAYNAAYEVPPCGRASVFQAAACGAFSRSRRRIDRGRRWRGGRPA